MDEISLREPEDGILCNRARIFDFPAVSVYENSIHFNAACDGLFHSDRVHVSKTLDLLIFRDAELNSRRMSFTLCRNNKKCRCFTIYSTTIIRFSGLKVGSSYRLYRIKGGGYAVKRYEPEQV